MVNVIKEAHDWAIIESRSKHYSIGLFNDWLNKPRKSEAEIQLIKKLSMNEIRLIYEPNEVPLDEIKRYYS
ncbi:hypothetical protein GX831_00690 [bacterium]|nr:hypothetical protein [bacterium]